MQEAHPATAARRFHPYARDLWTQRLRWATALTATGSLGVTVVLVGVAARQTPAHHTTSASSSASTGSVGSTGSTTTAAAGSVVSPSTGAAAPVTTGQS